MSVLLSTLTKVKPTIMVQQFSRYLLYCVLVYCSTKLGYANEYYRGAYSQNHWSLQTITLQSEGAIALAKYHQAQYAIFLHPKDARGYRAIIRLIDNHKMSNTLNRSYTFNEQEGLALITNIVGLSYERLGMLPQYFRLGNNSQRFNRKTKEIRLGTESEPVILHTHVMGRGDPNCEYIKGVPLRGPKAGDFFLFEFGHENSSIGNKKPVYWRRNEKQIVVNKLKHSLKKIVRERKLVSGLAFTF